MSVAKQGFSDDAVLLHEVETHLFGGPVLGIVLDGQRFETRNSEKRFGQSSKAITARLNR